MHILHSGTVVRAGCVCVCLPVAIFVRLSKLGKLVRCNPNFRPNPSLNNKLGEGRGGNDSLYIYMAALVCPLNQRENPSHESDSFFECFLQPSIMIQLLLITKKIFHMKSLPKVEREQHWTGQQDLIVQLCFFLEWVAQGYVGVVRNGFMHGYMQGWLCSMGKRKALPCQCPMNFFKSIAQ